MIQLIEQAIGRSVPRETWQGLERYVALLKNAAAEQNLISAATLDQVWQRHIEDSAQLIRFEPNDGASWLDIGSGAGLPGIVIALLVRGPVTLAEPRRLRAEFLAHVVSELKLAPRVTIAPTKAEHLQAQFDVITARAVAPLGRLLGLSNHLSHDGTVWVLPKGRSADSELAEARRSWQCEARSEASRTDPNARILVLGRVRARSKR